MSPIQSEWDYSSYVRKFLHTVAWIQVGQQAPRWEWISAFSEDGKVCGASSKIPIGQYVCGYNKNEISYYQEDFPVVQFFYKEMQPGVYRSKNTPSGIYYLRRRHLKSYKIGWSDETFRCIAVGAGIVSSVTRIGSDIDFDSPVVEYQGDASHEVFNQRLVRIGTSLFADGEEIGFMDKGLCILRHKLFEPLLRPYLEGKWQIES